MTMPEKQTSDKQNNTRNMVIAALTGQVGVLTLVIVLAAVFGGLALDNRYGTKPWFTVGLLVASIPVSIMTMVFLVRKAVSRVKTIKPEENPGKEDDIGKNS
jgi:F0F1-type ATP synthase assembly protein I